MGQLDPTKVFSNPGRLVIGPTNLGMSQPPLPPATTVVMTPGSQVINPGLRTIRASYLRTAVDGETLLGPPTTVMVPPGTHSITISGTVVYPAGYSSVFLYMTAANGTTFYLADFTSLSSYSRTISFNDTVLTSGSAYPADAPGAPTVGAYPYGSTTPVGIVTRAKLVRTNKTLVSVDEARGVKGASAYRSEEMAAFVFTLIQYDPTVLNMISASNTTSPNGFSGANTLSLPQPGRNVTPGLVPQQSPWLFASDDPAKPSILIFAPQVMWDAKLELDRVLNRPLETSLVGVCGLDSSGRDYREDLMENLSLT